jgi:hypothetical protein
MRAIGQVLVAVFFSASLAGADEPYLYFNASTGIGSCLTGRVPCEDGRTSIPSDWAILPIQCDVYLDFGDLPEVEACQIEIATDGIASISFQECTTGPSEYSSDWPDDGSSVTLTWFKECVPPSGDLGLENVAYLGYFLLQWDGGPATLEVVSASVGGATSVVPCGGEAVDIVATPLLALGDGSGENPCSPVPTRSASWGKVKDGF